jgi:hypothetical protein
MLHPPIKVAVAVVLEGGKSLSSANGGNGGSGVVIIKVPDTVTASFSGGVDFGNNAPAYDNGLPITSVSGFNIYCCIWHGHRQLKRSYLIKES